MKRAISNASTNTLSHSYANGMSFALKLDYEKMENDKKAVGLVDKM